MTEQPTRLHYVVVNVDETVTAVFLKRSLAFEERPKDGRVFECACPTPEAHIEQAPRAKWEREEK